MPRINMDKANIRQNVALYEGALARHGQYMRWQTASKCYCVDEMARPDPNCKECLGRGDIYSHVSQLDRVDRGMTTGAYTITTKANILSINSLVDNRNVAIPYASFVDDTITLVTPLPKGRMYHVDYVEDLTQTYTGVATYEGRGIIRVPITGISDLTGNYIGEIISITSAVNTTRSENINVISFWENLILTDSNMDLTDEITIECITVNPVKFLISGIDQKEKYERSYVAQEADAQLTTPGRYYMGSGDLITLIKAKQRVSVIGITNRGEEFHVLPFFHVKSIFNITDALGTITDATIVRNNEIQWGLRIPEKFSITLMYSPTFAVLPDLPQLRYAENKVFPRKVMLKQWDMNSRGNKRPSAVGAGLNQGNLMY